MAQNKYNPLSVVGKAIKGMVSNQPTKKVATPKAAATPTPGVGQSTPASGTGYGYTPVANSAGNQNNYNKTGAHWTMDHSDGGIYGHTNGKISQAMKNDPAHYNSAQQSYLSQFDGGYADTSTVNNPTGWEKAYGLLDNGNKAQGDAVKQGINAALTRLQGQKDDTNSQFDNSNRAAYINYMLGQKNMDQRLAASGLAKTGTSESTRLGAELNYQNLLNSNEQERDKALRDLANDMADVEAQGAKSLADLEANKGNQAANLYTQLLGNAQNQWNADRDYLQNSRQQNMENTMNMVNMLMTMNATGKTTYNQLKQLLPNLQGGDMNYYNLARQLGLDKMLQQRQ